MTRRWAPNDRQRELAEYLAAGYSINRASQVMGIDYRTCWEWCQLSVMQAYIMEVRDRLMASQVPMFENIVALAQAIYLQGLTGERGPSDPALVLADRVLTNTLWKHAKPRAADRTESVGPGDRRAELPEGGAA
jgi:hypothetical protein